MTVIYDKDGMLVLLLILAGVTAFSWLRVWYKPPEHWYWWAALGSAGMLALLWAFNKWAQL